MSEIYFSDIMTTHNHPPSYAKHALGSIYVFFLPYLGIGCGGGGVLTREWFTT